MTRPPVPLGQLSIPERALTLVLAIIVVAGQLGGVISLISYRFKTDEPPARPSSPIPNTYSARST